MRNYKSTFGVTECRGEIILHWNKNVKQGVGKKRNSRECECGFKGKKTKNLCGEELI